MIKSGPVLVDLYNVCNMSKISWQKLAAVEGAKVVQSLHDLIFNFLILQLIVFTFLLLRQFLYW